MSPIATRVADRLAAATQAGDFSALLTPEAGTDALALLREATPGPDQPIDEPALGDVCMTLFLRGQAMARAGGSDLIAAGLVGGLLFQRAPRFLPAALRDVLASTDDPLREARFAFAATAAHATAVLSGEDGPGPGAVPAAAGETGPAGLAELDRALAWSEVAHRAITDRGTAAEAADVTVQRLGLLTARFQLAADLDALTEAARDGLAILDRLSPENTDHVAYLPPLAATVVTAALLLGSPAAEEAERVVAMLPSGTATETTTGMLSMLRACHAEPLTWPGEVDARVGLILTAEAGRTGYPGLFAVAASRLRTALAGIPEDHAQHRPLTNALGAALIGLGERREDTETVQEGLTLLGRSGRLFRLLADQLGGPGMPAELGAAAAILDLLAGVAAGANSDQPRTDDWRENFADAVGRLPERHPRRSVYTSLLTAVTDDPDSVSTAGVLAAAQVDWRGLATELRAAGPANQLALDLANTFEQAATNLGEVGDVVALLDSLRGIEGEGDDRDVRAERIRDTLAAMVNADNDVLSAELRADLLGLLGILTIDRAVATDDPAALRQAIQDMARSQRSAGPGVANEIAAGLGIALVLSMLGEQDRIGAWDQNWDQETRLSIATLLAARRRHDPGDGQDASAAPRFEDALATFGEMIMAATTFNAETELSQLDKFEEAGQQLVAMLSKLNPGAGEEVAVLVDTLTAGATGAVHRLEAIQQNRAAESDAETVADIRRRLAELPPNHPARAAVQGQLAIQLSGQAFDLCDVDPVRGKQLLAEALGLIEQVGEPFTAILRHATDRAAAALDHRELPAIPGQRPGTSPHEVRERLDQAGNSPEAIRDMLADQDLPVWLRVNAGFTTAFRLLSDLRVGDGLECAEGTVDLLATITDRGADPASAEHAIAGLIGGLPATAVSGVLGTLHSLGGSRTLTGPLVDRAAVLAERSRGLLLARQLEGRTDLGDLSAAHPELAGRFEALTAQLAADPDMLATLRPGDNPPTSGRAEWSRLVKSRASRELDTLIAQIRDEDDFHDFLRPPTADQLRALAIDGPVVLLNYPAMPQEASTPVTPFALIVTRDAITSLRIEVTPAEVEQMTGRWTAAVAAVNSRGRERPGPVDLRRAATDMTEVLSWTWHHVVSPVLATAGLPAHADADVDWPRIWWIPDGPFHALPLHAAQCPPSDCQLGGPERTGCGAALDSVVSSYVPGLRTLAHTRRPATGPAANTALIVAVSDDELPGAADAARAAAERLHAGPVLVGDAASREVVVKALADVGVAHFGCHATSDPAEPSGGVLHLPSGEPLAVREICRARPRAARLAFLTACSTARTSRRLANEAIHLSSAFLVAGFSEAVGTLWEIDSRDAERVTADFYRQITGRSPRDGALALHHSVLALRNERPGDPHIWSAYVHAGAKPRERPVPDDRSGAECDSGRMPCRIGIVTS